MNFKHGGVATSEYRSWSMMKDRCLNPKNRAYGRYGGRGIKISERWLDFSNFLADMGQKPSPEHSLDRINNNGDYAPGNCRWATDSEQGRNKRNNSMLTLNGETLCITEWGIRAGLKRGTIQARLAYGWSVERALTEGVMSFSDAGRIGGIARHA